MTRDEMIQQFVDSNDIKTKKYKCLDPKKRVTRDYKGIMYFTARRKLGCPCGAGLTGRANPSGGRYLECVSYGADCYYIGYRDDKAGGEEKVWIGWR